MLFFQPSINMEDCGVYNQICRFSTLNLATLIRLVLCSTTEQGKHEQRALWKKRDSNLVWAQTIQRTTIELRYNKISWSTKDQLVIIIGWYTVKKVNWGEKNNKTKKQQQRLLQCEGLEEGRFAGVTSDYWNIRLVSKFKAMFVPGGRFTNIILGFRALKTVCINNKRSPFCILPLPVRWSMWWPAL